MKIPSHRMQSIILALVCIALCPLHAQAETDLPHSYDVEIKVTDEDDVFGPVSLTVVPGIPASLAVSGNDNAADYKLSVLTSSYRLQTGDDAVLLELTARRQDQDRWTTIGEPKLVLQPGEEGLVTVDNGKQSAQFHVLIK